MLRNQSCDFLLESVPTGMDPKKVPTYVEYSCGFIHINTILSTPIAGSHGWCATSSVHMLAGGAANYMGAYII